MRFWYILILVLVSSNTLQAASYAEVFFHHENSFVFSYLLDFVQNDSILKIYEELYTVKGLVTLGIFLALIIFVIIFIQYIYKLITLDKSQNLTLLEIFEMFIWKSWTNNILFKIILLTFISIVFLKPVPVVLMKPLMKNNQVFCWTPDINSHNAGTSLANVSTISNKDTVHVPLLFALPLGIIERMIYGFDLKEISDNKETGITTYGLNMEDGSNSSVMLTLKNKTPENGQEEYIYNGTFKQIEEMNYFLNTEDYEGCTISNSFVKLVGMNGDALGDAGQPIKKIVKLFSLQESIANVSVDVNTNHIERKESEKNILNLSKDLQEMNEETINKLFSGNEINKVFYKDQIDRINSKIDDLVKLLNKISSAESSQNANQGIKTGYKILSNVLLESIFPKRIEDLNSNLYVVNMNNEDLKEDCKAEITGNKMSCKDTMNTNSTRLVSMLKAEKIARNEVINNGLKFDNSTFLNVNENNFENLGKYLHGNDIIGFGHIPTQDITDYTGVIGDASLSTTDFQNQSQVGQSNFINNFLQRTITTNNLTIKSFGESYQLIKEGKYYYRQLINGKSIGIDYDEDENTNAKDKINSTTENTDSLKLIVPITPNEITVNSLAPQTVKYIFWEIMKKILETLKTPQGLFEKESFVNLLKESVIKVEISKNITSLPLNVTISKKDIKGIENNNINQAFEKEIVKYMNVSKLIYEINYIKNILKIAEDFLSDREKMLSVFLPEVDENGNELYTNMSNILDKWLEGQITINGYGLNPYIHQSTKISSELKTHVFQRLSPFEGLYSINNNPPKESSTITTGQITPIESYNYKEDKILETKITFIDETEYNLTKSSDNNKSYLYTQKNSKSMPFLSTYIKGNEKIKTDNYTDNGLYYSIDLLNDTIKTKGLYGNKYMDTLNNVKVLENQNISCNTEDLTTCIFSLTNLKIQDNLISNNSFTPKEFHTTEGNLLTEVFFLNIEEDNIEDKNKSLYSINKERISSIEEFINGIINFENFYNIKGINYNVLLRDLMLSFSDYIEVDKDNNTIKWSTTPTISEGQLKEKNNYIKKLLETKTNWSEIEKCLPSGTSYDNVSTQNINNIKITLQNLSKKERLFCTNYGNLYDKSKVNFVVEKYQEAREMLGMGDDIYIDYAKTILLKMDTFNQLKSDIEDLANNQDNPLYFFQVLAKTLVLNLKDSIFQTNQLDITKLAYYLANTLSNIYGSGGVNEYERVQKLNYSYDTNISFDRSIDFVSYVGEDIIKNLSIDFLGNKNFDFEKMGSEEVLNLVFGIIKLIFLYSFGLLIISSLFLSVLATIIGWTLILILPVYAFFTKVLISDYKEHMRKNGGSSFIKIVDNVNTWIFKLVFASTLVYVVFTMIIIVSNVAIYKIGLNFLINNYLETISKEGSISAFEEIKVFLMLFALVYIIITISIIMLKMLNKWLKQTAIDDTMDFTSLVKGSIKDVTTSIKVK